MVRVLADLFLISDLESLEEFRLKAILCKLIEYVHHEVAPQEVALRHHQTNLKVISYKKYRQYFVVIPGLLLVGVFETGVVLVDEFDASGLPGKAAGR